MTPTASASPITLLTTVMEPATASSGSAASVANNAVSAEGDSDNLLLPSLEGGFQLLIDAAAQQQTAAPVPLKSSTKTATTGKTNSEESGNVLPLLTALLPSTTDTQGTTTQNVIGGQDSDGQSPAKNSDDKSAAQTTPDAAAVQLLWTPINVQAPVAATNAPVVNTATAKTDADAAATNAVASVVAPAANPIGAAIATAAAPAAGEQAAAAAQENLSPNDALPNKASTGDRHSSGNRADVLAVTSNNATKLDVAPQDLIGATQKPADTPTSFADLLKPANTAPTVNPLAAPPEASRAQQAARPYVEMNSTGATVSVPVGSSGWSDAVVDKVMWFSANKLSSAEIQLNPPDLGPLQVRISTQHDQASVVFSSPHAAVRDALDQALPKLRDMFGGQGIQLSDASVGGQGAQAQQQQQQSNNRQAPAMSSFFQNDDGAVTPTAVTRVQVPRLSTSAVDAYA